MAHDAIFGLMAFAPLTLESAEGLDARRRLALGGVRAGLGMKRPRALGHAGGGWA